MREMEGEREEPASNSAEQSELERLRGLLLQSAKLAELGTRVASLVHEMNQPLVAIKAFAQMIRASETDETVLRRASFIEEQADVLSRLVARMRSHARVGSGGRSSELALVAERTLELLEHLFRRGRVEVELALGSTPILVPMDEIHLQQLLVNLLTNAADAVEDSEQRRIRLSSGETLDDVWLAVEDSGPGISDEIADKIMDPFFTTKDPDRGTGLGLPICQEIVGCCGGSIEIFSRSQAAADENLGLRTVVEVRLPSVMALEHAKANDGGAE